MTQGEFDLLHGYLDGTLPEADFARLQSLLRESAEARRTLRCLATVGAKLHQLAAINPATLRLLATPVVPETRRAHAWFSWRPLTAAAAGLAIGSLSASMVWAYAVPMAKSTIEQAVALLSEGFEQAAAKLGAGFPRRANEWSGEITLVSGPEDGVEPAEGGHMVRLTRRPERRLGYARYIMDAADFPVAPPGASRRLEVSARFDSPPVEQVLRYQVRLAAFREAPEEVREIWNNEPLLFETLLQHVGRNVEVEPGARGWHEVTASMEPPPETRSVVLSLRAGETSVAQPLAHQYLDDVQVRLIAREAPPP
jgi:hypothetical protein